MRSEFTSIAAALPARIPVRTSVRYPREHTSRTGFGVESFVAGAFVCATRLLTCVRARWLGCEPTDAPRIYFANHSSHLDFLLLWSALPARLRRKTRPVAASDYWHQGALRRYLAIRVFRSVFVERDNPDRSANPIAPLVEALDQGESLIVFPEGTRGTGEDLLPFKAGIFHALCTRPDTELVPVWIDNSYRVMPKGAVLPIPLLCTATFGPPARITRSEEKTAFLRRMRERLLALRNA